MSGRGTVGDKVTVMAHSGTASSSHSLEESLMLETGGGSSSGGSGGGSSLGCSLVYSSTQRQCTQMGLLLLEERRLWKRRAGTSKKFPDSSLPPESTL